MEGPVTATVTKTSEDDDVRLVVCVCVVQVNIFSIIYRSDSNQPYKQKLPGTENNALFLGIVAKARY